MDRARRDAEFTEFYVSRVRALRRIAYVIVHDWHGAEDVTQLALVKVYGAWPRIRSETLEAYARRAVVNESLTYLRRRHDVPTDEVPERTAESGPEPSRLDLAAALRALPPRQRAVVALRFVDDLSVAQTAEVLHVADGTVKSHTAKAMDSLRRVLPDLITEP